MPDTYISFDFGTKRIGVAVGQSLTKSATPLHTIHAKEGVPDWQEISNLIKTWKPKALIVGIPLNMDGTVQQITYAAQQFAAHLQTHYQLPVHLVDERLTTVEARSRVFEKGGYKALKKHSIDSYAAKIILESWLADH